MCIYIYIYTLNLITHLIEVDGTAFAASSQTSITNKCHCFGGRECAPHIHVTPLMMISLALRTELLKLQIAHDVRRASLCVPAYMYSYQ